MNENGNELGKRIAILRTERGLSRRELADSVQVGIGQIGHLENGVRYPSVDLAIRLAKFFDMPLGEFLGDDMPADWRALLQAAEVTA